MRALLTAAVIGPALILPGCAGVERHPAANPPAETTPAAGEFRLELSLPAELEESATEGFARTVTVVVANSGTLPVAVLELWLEGPATGRRQLTVNGPEGSDHLRAFGFLPPGENVRYRLGVGYPRAGAGVLTLWARVRLLPLETPGKVMQEVTISPTGPEELIFARTSINVSPRGFDRAVAVARARASTGEKPKETAYSRTLEGWVLVMPSRTLLCTRSETRDLPSLSLAAIYLMDQTDGAVPVLDPGGRLRSVPKGPLLMLLLEESQREGKKIFTAQTIEGREALFVE